MNGEVIIKEYNWDKIIVSCCCFNFCGSEICIKWFSDVCLKKVYS